MEHNEDEEDSGSTILIESDEDLYDSDATEISEDEDQQEEHRGQSRPRSQEESQVNTDPSLPALPTIPGQGSQSDSESLLMLPQQSSWNQINPADTGLLQLRHGALR